MAVIIKDMEKLPDSCFNCELHNYHFCNLTGNCIEENWDNGTRADDCPLEEVLTKDTYEDLCKRASMSEQERWLRGL